MRRFSEKPKSEHCVPDLRSASRLTVVTTAAALLALGACTPRGEPPPLETIPSPAEPTPSTPAPDAAPEPEIESLPSAPMSQAQGEALWHLRSAVNVAALICRGGRLPDLARPYNAMLRRHRLLLIDAAEIEARQFRANGGSWQVRYDQHMTQLYNRYARTEKRSAYCAAAEAILSDAATAGSSDLVAASGAMLGRMDAASAAR